MNQKEITKTILSLLDNKTTKVVENSEIQANYYNFATDTIYLSLNMDENKQPRGLDNANPFCAKLVTMCHECIHSTQSKFLHVVNIILSNISIILAIIALVLRFTCGKVLIYSITASVIIVFAIFVRAKLELEAITKSTILAKRVLETYKVENVENKDIKEAEIIIKKLLPIQMLRMLLDKIVMLILVIVI